MRPPGIADQALENGRTHWLGRTAHSQKRDLGGVESRELLLDDRDDPPLLVDWRDRKLDELNC